ncbi:response regulator transcription factor [Kitasatospora viridis]|uniref:LuxR family two component transcriptional regulator n=1 Tax=Kitasatospora viridis TaxID=281105 RepID=A0A561UCF8_9ACTN|nr:LuxR family two component transcriptional regulator [Kitasatospora viridis]
MMSSSPAVRVLIADDHPVFAAGLRILLQTMQGVEVVGEVDTGRAAVAAARETRPDVIFMDVDMPQMNGIAATQAIVAQGTGAAVLMLTILDDIDTVLGALRAGARGYLLKGAGPEDITRALAAVRQGALIFGPQVAGLVVDHITKPVAPPSVIFPELTDRERDVLRLVADGRGNAAIASELSLSIKTVRNYLSRIFAKLQVTHRTEAAIRARQEGLGA